MNIEKYIMNMKKIAERLLNKVPFSSYKSKIRAILEWPRLRFSAISVGEIGAILSQSGPLKQDVLTFFIRRYSGKHSYFYLTIYSFDFLFWQAQNANLTYLLFVNFSELCWGSLHILKIKRQLFEITVRKYSKKLVLRALNK